MRTVFTLTSKNSIRKIIFFLAIILLFSSISLFAANAAFLVTDQIYEGIQVGNIPLGGLSISSAEQRLSVALQEKLTETPIKISYNDQTWYISAQDIDLSFDPQQLSNDAYLIGRTGHIFQQLHDRYLAVNKGYPLPLRIYYNEKKLRNILETIQKKLDLDPHNAYVEYSGSAITVVPEIIGRKVDIDKTINQIVASASTDLPVNISICIDDRIVPPVLQKDLEQLDTVLASYTTHFDSTDYNRSQNILLATKSINGFLMRPNEIFSFNDIVGPRLPKFGFKEAPAYLDGQLVIDWGGGVCQVTSTLYNSVLLANLAITERTSHCRPPAYVPLGQDATVADNQLDFRFKNNLSNNVYIIALCSGNNLNVTILGKNDPNKPEIRIFATDQRTISPNIIVRKDPNLDRGKEIVETEGQVGFYVSTYRVQIKNGQEVSREHLAYDEYPAVDKVVRVGIKSPIQQQPPDTHSMSPLQAQAIPQGF